MIPQGWQEKTLGEVCEIISGTTPDTANNEFWGKGNYWITPAEINEDSLYINGTARTITNRAVECCSLRKMPRGTVLFSSRAPIGKIAISNVDVLYCNQGFKNFICSKNINNKFLYYFLFKNKKYLISLGKGTTFKEVSKSIISVVNIQYPPLPEQERIVAKLDKAFEAIDKVKANAEQNLTNTKELFESYLNNIFSNINASFNKKLSDVTKIVGGGTPSKSTPTYYQGNIPWATVRDMNEDDLSKTEFSITNEAVKSSATNIIPANNVIIATRVGLGKVCILMQDTAINQDLKGIIPTKPMNFKYLFWWFKSIKNKIEEAGVGATVKGVKLPFVQNLQIPYISINDQQKIVEKLDALQEQTKRLEQIYTQKIKECNELKQSILQKAFRGEL